MPPSYPGPLITTQIPAVIKDIFTFYPSCRSLWQLSLWGYNVFSSHYGKLWFILFGPHSYFVWHENKVNYILESFANEILKPISEIKFTAVLFSSREGEGRRGSTLNLMAILPSFTERLLWCFWGWWWHDTAHKLCWASRREKFRNVFLSFYVSKLNFCWLQVCNWLLWEQHQLLIRLVLIPVSVRTGLTPQGVGLWFFSFLQGSFSELIRSWDRQVTQVA